MTPHIMRLLNNKQFKSALQDSEQTIYELTYKHTKQNQTLSAELLGVSRGTFRYKMKNWRLL